MPMRHGVRLATSPHHVANHTRVVKILAPPAPHHTLVGQWLHDFLNFATTWLPVFFILILALTAWLLWRMVGMMPRIKPVNLARKSSDETTWDDVAGVEEVRGELMEVVDLLNIEEAQEKLVSDTPKGLILFATPCPGKTLHAIAIALEAVANF